MHTKLFIDGQWRDPLVASTLPALNPATEETVADVAAGAAQDVALAVAAARVALPAWRAIGGTGRAAYLRAIAQGIRDRTEELAALSSRNNGKPLAEARLDVGDAAATYDYYATLAVKLDAAQEAPVSLEVKEFRSTTRLESVGVVALIVPWNFPLTTAAWKVAPALAAGCTVVLKCSEITPLPELALGAIAAAVALPRGVLNIINGTGAEVGAPLCAHPHVDKISFTGSNRVGEDIMARAARQMKRVTLETGGKSPMIVFEDADPDQAVEWIIGGIFFNCGQVCSATSRLLVHQDLAARLLPKLKAAAEALTIGDAFAENTVMGPITSAAQLATVMRYIESGRAEGLTLLTGGRRAPGFKRGWFVEPTIFIDVPTSSALWREEIFGPVLCVRTFATESEAIELANDSDFGLAAGIISADTARARRVARELEAGHIWINSLQVIFPQTSWGGFKRSSIGRELGPWGLQAFLEVKHITQPA